MSDFRNSRLVWEMSFLCDFRLRFRFAMPLCRLAEEIPLKTRGTRTAKDTTRLDDTKGRVGEEVRRVVREFALGDIASPHAHIRAIVHVIHRHGTARGGRTG